MSTPHAPAQPLSTRAIAAYAALAVPLAFAALPVYVHAPKFYTDHFALNLTAMGLVLLAIRLFDAIQDPIIGYLTDRFQPTRSRLWFVALGTPALMLGFALLFAPPTLAGNAALAWFGLSLALVYTAFSVVAIAYQAIGAELSQDYHERTRITAFREGFGLAGVLIASALPTVLMQTMDERHAFAWFAACFVGLMAVGYAITRYAGPVAPPAAVSAHAMPEHATSTAAFWAGLYAPLRVAAFRRLLGVYMVNGIATSIPATLILFFVDDVLGATEHQGGFLFAYFLTGAAAMPLWAKLSRRVGKRRAWAASMLLAVVTFIGAYRLGAGDIVGYYMVCMLSGLCLGANLSLPVSMLADVISAARDEARTASYFGLWSLSSKLNLALAAGIALPLLERLGYRSGTTNSAEALHALSFTYALLPCALMLLAVISVHFLKDEASHDPRDRRPH